MGTATGWNHPAQISWSLVTHWPTLLWQLIAKIGNTLVEWHYTLRLSQYGYDIFACLMISCLSLCMPIGPLLLIWIDVNPILIAWISNYFPNLNGAAVEICEWILHPTIYWACDYLSMLRLKLNHNCIKSGPWWQAWTGCQWYQLNNLMLKCSTVGLSDDLFN